MRKYTGIEIGRLTFACLIPLLHIGLTGTVPFIAQQYLARLGVPFFYAVAGMFLVKSIDKKGALPALKQYIFRIGRMLLIWVLIYLPIILLRDGGLSLNELLFKTPAYLWFLTGLVVASVPFCLIKNRKALLWFSLLLYFSGTVFGEAYGKITGGFPLYEKFFLTTRNGLFFGLPMMCVGEATWRREKVPIYEFLLHGCLLAAEVTLICFYSEPGSMYISLPGFIYCLIIACRNWNPHINTTYFGGISSAIYVMQFGIITVVMKAAEFFGLSGNWLHLAAWFMVIFLPAAFYLILRKAKIIKILF